MSIQTLDHSALLVQGVRGINIVPTLYKHTFALLKHCQALHEAKMPPQMHIYSTEITDLKHNGPIYNSPNITYTFPFATDVTEKLSLLLALFGRNSTKSAFDFVWTF